MINKPHEAKIEIACGPMFAGKTDELIRRLRRLKYSHTSFLLFKPKIDTRYSEDNVVTHDNNFLQAIIVDSAHEILKICEAHPDIKVIAIDEAQFFLKEEAMGSANLLEACQVLKRHGYRIILTGLDMDSLGQPFGLMPQLLAIADDILKLRSVCLICGSDASMSFRYDDFDNQVELGSTDKYQARCYDCWQTGMLEQQEKQKAALKKQQESQENEDSKKSE